MPNRDLVRALTLAGKSADDDRTPIPALRHVRVVAKGKEVVFEARSFSSAIRLTEEAEVIEPGAFLLPKALIEMASFMPDGSARIETMEHTMRIKLSSGNFPRYFDVPGMSDKEWSAGPALGEHTRSHTFPIATLLAGIRLAYPFVGDDESQKGKNTLSLSWTASELRATSTDGHRMTRVIFPIENAEPATLPLFKKTVSTLKHVLEHALKSGEKDCTVLRTNTAFAVRIGKVEFVAPLSDADFPDVNMVIPKEWGMRAEVSRLELMESIGAAEVTDAKGGVSFSVSKGNDSLDVVVTSVEMGNSNDAVKLVSVDNKWASKLSGTKWSGGESTEGRRETKTSAKYMREALAVFESETVAIVMPAGDKEPVVMVAGDDAAKRPADVKRLAIIMPMQ